MSSRMEPHLTLEISEIVVVGEVEFEAEPPTPETTIPTAFPDTPVLQWLTPQTCSPRPQPSSSPSSSFQLLF